MTDQKTELTALVELFGHQKVAGTVTEHAFGSSTFVRIDVPETKEQPKFTRFVNPSAVYAINPVTPEVMHQMAENLNEKPIDSWDIRQINKKLLALGEKGKDDSNDLGF